MDYDHMGICSGRWPDNFRSFTEIEMDGRNGTSSIIADNLAIKFNC